MFGDHQAAMAEVLQAQGLLSAAQLAEVEAAQRVSGQALADVVITQGLATRADVLQAVAQALGLEVWATVPSPLPPEVLTILQPEQARRYGVVPVRATAAVLEVLAVDPFNHQVVDDLTFALQRDVVVHVADPAVVQRLIETHYGVETTALEDIIAALPEPGAVQEAADLHDLAEQAADAPVIRFVDRVLTRAVEAQASDLHFEPWADAFRIRYRVDGALLEMPSPPPALAVPVISRLKVLADLNIAERRVPQDGRIKRTIAGRPVDLRVSTLPTQDGESVVLRVLDKGIVNLDLEALGLPGEILGQIRHVMARPNGIFLVTGPTGSGKTTTLYSALREVNTEDTKILTAEDPVEYEIEGLVQTAINPAIGLTFAAALRSFLRQDPDKILVGEIRDLETAQIAVQASLTGHLVLSTLHTNDAPGAVTRLIDMGVEPYLIAASLEAVLAQRLLRRVCPDCRTAYPPTDRELRALGLTRETLQGQPFFRGTGCASCQQTGYRGRQGLFEMILVDDAFRELISTRASTLDLKRAARASGMIPLRDDGLRALYAGQTTVEAVLRYT